MEHFPEFKDDVSFLKQLILEQGVVCMPGSVSIIYRTGLKFIREFHSCIYTDIQVPQWYEDRTDNATEQADRCVE